MPDAVIHLAAQSSPTSWDEPAGTYEVNVLGAIHTARSRPQAPRRPGCCGGSSAEYAEPSMAAIARTRDRSEQSYGASKLAVDQLVQLYDDAMARPHSLSPFFLIGPRSPANVCSDFARRIVAIERGSRHVACARSTSCAISRMFVDGAPASSGSWSGPAR